MSSAPFLKMNGLGNEIIVADMRGRADRITAQRAQGIEPVHAIADGQQCVIHALRELHVLQQHRIIDPPHLDDDQAHEREGDDQEGVEGQVSKGRNAREQRGRSRGPHRLEPDIDPGVEHFGRRYCRSRTRRA